MSEYERNAHVIKLMYSFQMVRVLVRIVAVRGPCDIPREYLNKKSNRLIHSVGTVENVNEP